MVGTRRFKAHHRLIALFIAIFPLIYFGVNFRWQILDDGLIWNRILFPPFSETAMEFTKSVGRNYIGLGLLIEIFWKLFGTNVLGYFFFNYLIWIAVSSLSYLLIWRETKMKKIASFGAAAVFLLPVAPEIFLTLIKFEKFSALAILLAFLGLQNHQKTHDFKKNWMYFIASFTISILCSKETVIFSLIPIVSYVLWKSKKDISSPKKRNQILTVILIVLFFIIFKYIYPSLMVNPDGYTSSFGLRTFSEIKSNLVAYSFRETTVIFLLGLNLVFILLSKFKKIPFSAIGIWIFVTGLSEFVFFLVFWNQVQIYYLYNIELALLLSTILNIYNFKNGTTKASLKIFLVPLLSVILIFSINTFALRAVSLTQAHLIDGKLIGKFKEEKGDLILNFQSGSEMPMNIWYITGFVPKLLLEIKDKAKLCNQRIAFLYASPSNINFGVRGINWEKLQTQKELLSVSGIELVEEYSSDYQRNFWVTGTELPKLISLVKPKIQKFEYGLSIQRVKCD